MIVSVNIFYSLYRRQKAILKMSPAVTVKVVLPLVQKG